MFFCANNARMQEINVRVAQSIASHEVAPVRIFLLTRIIKTAILKFYIFWTKRRQLTENFQETESVPDI